MEKEIEQSEDTTIERQKLFNELIIPHKNLIYRICLDNTKNSSDTDDNYQECLINFFKYIKSYNKEKSLLTWIHIVSKRHVLSIERKRDQHRSDCIGTERIVDEFVTQCDETPAGITIDNYRDVLSDEVIAAIDDLSPIYRDTFLKKISGYKLKEIVTSSHADGNLKSNNLQTVKSRLYLARQQLQTALSDYSG